MPNKDLDDELLDGELEEPEDLEEADLEDLEDDAEDDLADDDALVEEESLDEEAVGLTVTDEDDEEEDDEEEGDDVEAALDLFVYPPVGPALSGREPLPKLVERGRKQLSGQATMARMIGEFAFRQGQQEAGKALDQARRQAEEVLTGLRPPARSARPPL